MNPLYDKLELKRPSPVHEQIREHVRGLIVTGHLVPGERIPSDQQLAQRWGTHQPTVHLALRSLVREGLLQRVSRVGTFVRKREEKLTCIGIYCRSDFWKVPDAAFKRSIYAAICEELKRLGIEARTWIDPRSEDAYDQPWPELCHAAEHREIQGLIGVQINPKLLQWQNRLPIPYAFLDSTNYPNAVGHDLRQLIEMSLRALVEQGCRSVGLISPIARQVHPADGQSHDFAGFREWFVDLAGKLGLVLREQWMRLSPSEEQSRRQPQEHFGYEAFLRLWSQAERPDGLVVFPDTAARGVILGLKEHQVRVPQDLKVVFHKNEAVDLLCPMPAMYAVTSEHEAARTLIEQVRKQFRGQSCQHVLLPARLEIHNAGIHVKSETLISPQ
ncbi:MAG: GntR family transcriptional regulator [Phycisphaeraceae bacterium]|nr:GntR family transcriptional regulator [Phycisphaeraceae bacterium]